MAFNVRFAIYGVEGIRYSRGTAENIEHVIMTCTRLLERNETDTRIVAQFKRNGYEMRYEVKQKHKSGGRA